MPHDDDKTVEPRRGAGSLRSVGEAGMRAGPFVLESRLGSGGMGEVWAARHERNGLPVALKLIRRTAYESRDAASPIIEEFRMLRDVHHPHVVRVHDTGACTIDGDDCPWVAMELIPGAQPIDEYARGRPLVDRLRVFHEAVTGLARVHHLGGKHLDIKPDNILVDEDGRAVLTDFGLARPMLGWRREVTAGTPRYMSPEQTTSFSRADQRSDIWSCGLVLAELATGPEARTLSSSTTVECDSSTAALFEACVGEALGPDHPELATAIGRIVARCLADHPGDRYQNAGELAAALDRVIEYARTEDARLAAASRRRGRTAATLIGAAGVIGAAVGLLTATPVLRAFEIPTTWYERFLGPPREALTTLPVLPDVVLVEVTNEAINDLARRPELAEIGVTPFDLYSRRPLYGRAYERLAEAGASGVVSDIFFSSPQTVDDALAASIRRVRAAGVGVTIGVGALQFDNGRPLMSPAVWSAGPAWGVATMNDHASGRWWTYLAVEREGMSVIPSLALSAFAEHEAPGLDHEYVVVDGGVRIRHSPPTDDPRGARSYVGETWIAATAADRVGPSTEQYDDSRPDDVQWSFAFSPPARAAIDASTVSITDLWDLSPERLQARMRDRIVLFYDRDRDKTTDRQQMLGGQVHAASIQTMVLRVQERVAVGWNIPLAFAAGLAAAALTMIARRRAWLAPIVAGAITVAAVFGAAWLVHRLSGVWLHPFPALLAAVIAALLIAVLGDRLQPRPRVSEVTS